MAHHDNDLPKQTSHPLLWTVGMVVFIMIVGFWLRYQYDQGVHHAKNNPHAPPPAPTAGQEVPDHAELITSLDEAEMIKQGKAVYGKVCATCHGMSGAADVGVANARNFNQEAFKFGADPYSMYLTVVQGNGAMGAQLRDPVEAYATVAYVREAFLKSNNPDMYVEVTEEYLADGEWPSPGQVADGAPAPSGAELKARPLEVPVRGVLASWADTVEQHEDLRLRFQLAAEQLGDTTAGRNLAQLAWRPGAEVVLQSLHQAVEADDKAAFVALVSAPGLDSGMAGLAALSATELDAVYRAITSVAVPAAPGHHPAPRPDHAHDDSAAEAHN